MTKIEDHHNKRGQKEKKNLFKNSNTRCFVKNSLYEMRWASKNSLFIQSHCDPAKHRKTAARKLSFKV